MSDLNSSFQEETFTFGQTAPVTAGNTYWLVAHADQIDSTNYTRIQYDNIGGQNWQIKKSNASLANWEIRDDDAYINLTLNGLINPPSHESYIALDGVDDYLSTPDGVQNSITGDFEIIAKVAADDWTPFSSQTIVSKYLTTGDNKAVLFYLETTGKISLVVSHDGFSNETEISSVSTGFSNGSSHWCRVTYSTTGDVNFYTASTDDFPETWTQLGATQTSTTTSISDSSTSWELGSYQNGANALFPGKFYYAEVRDGIGGNVVARFNASDGSDPDYNNVPGQTNWTNNGGTPGSDINATDADNLVAWYTADAGVYSDAGVTLLDSSAEDATTVQQWNDQSGNGNHLDESSSSQKPTFKWDDQNGLPGIDFDGTDDFLDLDATLLDSSPITVYVIAKRASNTSNDTLVAFVGKTANTHLYNLRLLSDSNGSYVQWRSRDGQTSAQASTTAAILPGATHLLVGQEVSTILRNSWIDGGDKGANTETRSPVGIDNFGLGANVDAVPDTHFHGTIYEVRVYSAPHDDATRALVEAEMNTKWGINQSPTNQPPNIPPVAFSVSEDDTSPQTGTAVPANADPDGDPVTVDSVTSGGGSGSAGNPVAGDHGSLTISDNGDGSFNYSYQLSQTLDSLPLGNNDTDSFTFSASDDQNNSVNVSVTVTINGLNDAPVFNTASGIDSIPNATEGVAYDQTIPTSQFSDPDTGTNLTYELAGSPPSGFIFENTGRLHTNGQPVSSAAAAGSPYSLTINATDGTADSPGDAFTLTVNAASSGGGTDPADAPLYLNNSDTGSSTSSDGSRIDLSGTDLIIENRETDSFIRVLNAGSERFVIDPSGNFGLGTTSPTYKLDVQGTIRAEEIIVEITQPDYVFKDGYNLRSLDEVEAFIEENGHLPGIPSAAEVEQSGVSLGDSQRLLLEKIEELTLYILELKKQNEAQQAEIEQLKSQIKD